MGPRVRGDDGDAMSDTPPRSRGAFRPSYARKLRSLKTRGRRGMPDARCTRGLACKMDKKRTRAYRFSGGNPAFPAQWFYGLLRALLGDRALLPPSTAKAFLFRKLEHSV